MNAGAMAKAGAHWPAGDGARAAEAVSRISRALDDASEATVGDTTSWELLRLSRLLAGGMAQELFDPDLDNGHLADATASLQAQIIGAQAVSDATPGAAAHIRGALISTSDLWQHLGYSGPMARKGPKP